RQRSKALRMLRLSGRGEGRQRLAVEGSLRRQDNRASTPRPHQLDRCLDGFCPRRREDTASPLTRHMAGQFLRPDNGMRSAGGRKHCGLGGIEGGTDRGDDRGGIVAKKHGAVLRGTVEEAAPLSVEQPDTLATYPRMVQPAESQQALECGVEKTFHR